MRKVFVIFALVLSASVILAQSGPGQSRPRRVDPEPQAAPVSNPGTAPDLNPSSGEMVREDEVIRVNTSLVTVPVSVLDRDGRYITDLQKQDFQIYEDSVAQDIAYFATVEEPVTVVLMIDTSTSIWSKLDEVKDAAEAFVDQLRPEDPVMVVSFARGLTVEGEATTDRRKIFRAIDRTGKGSSTHLYDAVDKVMRKQLAGIKGRKAVVLFTDGVDATSKNATYQSTLTYAQEFDAVIYPIRYDTYDPDKDSSANSRGGNGIPGILGKIISIKIGSSSSGGNSGYSRAEYDRGEEYLKELAEATGGRAHEASRDLSLLKNAFSQIANELTRQYTLGYYPRKDEGAGERRGIRVAVGRSSVAIRARTGYVFQNRTAAPTKP